MISDSAGRKERGSWFDETEEEIGRMRRKTEKEAERVMM